MHQGRRPAMNQNSPKYDQSVTIAKRFYFATRSDHDSVDYAIYVNDDCIDSISENTAQLIYEKLGKLLNEKNTQP
jgi:hypothetical protein